MEQINENQELSDQELMDIVTGVEVNVDGGDLPGEIQFGIDIGGGMSARSVSASDVGPSMEKVNEFIAGQKKVNTIRSTARDIKCISDWFAREKFDIRPIDSIPPSELNELMAQFFVFIKKKDGNEYQPNTLTSFMYSLDRYLRDCKYTWDGERVEIMKDIRFEDMRNALSSKRKELKSLGLGNRPHRSVSVEEAEERIMWEKGVLGTGTPFGLQFTLWYFFTLFMGLRGRDEHRKIQFGDISIQKNGSEEFLQLRERSSKTRDGEFGPDCRSTSQKIFCTCSSAGPECCIVEIYKIFVARRPADHCRDSDPFYLQFKTDSQIASSKTDIWYKREPLGMNSLAKMLPKACSLAGIQERGNHGVRASTVQRLRRAGVPDDKVIQVTGHKSIKTLSVYDRDQLETNEHRKIQGVLQSAAVATSAASVEDNGTVNVLPAQINNASFSVSSVSSTSHSLFAGAYINNCVFNISAIRPDTSSD